MSSGAPRLAMEAARSIVARYVIYVLGLVGSIVLARALGASGRGAYAYVTTIGTTVVTLAHLSIEHALIYEWRSGNRRELIGAALIATFVLSAVGTSVAILVVQSGGIVGPNGVDPWMLYLACGVVPLLLGAQYANTVLINEGLIRAVNGSELMMTALRVAFFVVLGGAGLLDVSSALIIWAATMAVLLVAKVRSAVAAVGASVPDLTVIKRILFRGLRYHVGALSLAMILRVDVLLLASRVSVTDLGRYALAVTLAELAIRAGEASSQVAVQAQIQPDHEEVARVTARVARLNTMLSVILLLVLIAAGPFLITAVFGSSFAGTTAAVAALAPGIVALGLERPLGAYVIGLDKPLVVSAGMLIGLVSNVLLNLMLIPAWGIVGASVASSLVYVGLAIWIGTWFARSSGLGWKALRPSPRELLEITRVVAQRSRRA